MKNKCFDPGTIQAFTDGELEGSRSERLLKHVAGCDDCSRVLAECEEESSLAFSLLDEELNVLVPTERLRTRVFGEIGEIEAARRRGSVGGFLSGLAGLFDFGTPGLAVAASVLLIFGLLTVGITVLRDTDTGSSVAGGPSPAASVSEPAADPAPVVGSDSLPAPAEVSEQVGGPDGAPVRTDPRVRAIKTIHRIPAEADEDSSVPERTVTADNEVVSEDSYLQTIATLDRTVRYGKELLSASERVSFERDLAVVNNAIVKMKDEVRKNPDNRAAREVLNVSYQNKVDLLNSVAEKTELMASLQ